MKLLPASPDLSHLKKQAKHLLRDAESASPDALQRFIDALPSVHGADLATVATRELRLHDAQSVIAREYGFRSWTELKQYVEWKRTAGAGQLKKWLEWAYEGNARERRLAVRMLAEQPALFAGDAWLACAIGDLEFVTRAVDADPQWVNRMGGPMKMPPLVALTHSLLIKEDGFEQNMLACARLLLQHGADANSAWTNPKWPEPQQTAIYGAAGRTHNVAMTRLLLAAGADPNDQESLYHSVDVPDSTCTRLLLEAGATVNGTNALGRVLDFDKLDDLKLMIQRGGDVREGDRLHHAILRGRSMEHVRVLAEAGADLRTVNKEGISVYRWAQMHGRADVAAMLEEAGVSEPLSEEEQFVAACARGEDAAARSILERDPAIFSRLSEAQLKVLPELAASGGVESIRTMVEMGWPLEVQAGWGATALHHAIYRGNAPMVEFLLEHGAAWQAKNSFGGDALGTLSFASQDETMEEPAERDYVGCARSLLAHGMLLPSQKMTFRSDVVDYFDSLRGEAE